MPELRLFLVGYLTVVLLLVTKIGILMTACVHAACAVIMLYMLWKEERQWRAEQQRKRIGRVQELCPQGRVS